VKIYAIPGHDEGQLALAPRSMEWFLVGDLIQGVGTVVVSSPEGDMKKYFASLARVIRLDPRVIIPSHGIPMGSVYRLRATLAHRQMREQQILELSESGKSKQEMLLEIYKDVDPRLHPLAMCNIESHLEKLRKERRL
jgi:glyoxylase-like metal-dependent hydrolase (beta-lactamase superfamily II)